MLTFVYWSERIEEVQADLDRSERSRHSAKKLDIAALKKYLLWLMEKEPRNVAKHPAIV